MVVIDIPPNPNCEAVELRVFHDLEAPKPVVRVRLQHDPSSTPQWYGVTGWTADGRTCPAWLQKVDDSGEGVAFLVYGGDGGLRFRYAGSSQPWNLAYPDQWGEPFLIVAELADVELASAQPVGEGIHGR